MSKKKAVGLLHYTAPPVVGGVESVLGHHARLLNQAGYTVRVIAGRGGEHYSKIQFTYIPLADSREPRILALKGHLDIGEVPHEFEETVKKIQAGLATAVKDLDFLIAHNVCSLHKNLALTAALRRICNQPGAPQLIMWHHDLAWTTPRYEAEMYPGWPWDLIRENWSEVQPKHVAVSSLRQRELAALLHISEDMIQVVPSGLDTEHFLKLDPITSELIKKTNYLQAALRLLLPVRITRRKNIEFAIRTVSALNQIMPQTNIIITGPPGPHNPANQIYFDQLKQLRSDLGMEGQVHFLAEIVSEYLPDVVIADFYRMADALFFPSLEEGFGIPILEAGVVGLPIFCADIPPLREIAGPHATYFSPEMDPFVLANVVIEKLQNNDFYQLRRHVRQHYTWDGVFESKILPLLK